MENFVIVAILFLIIGGIFLYIYKEKKSGKKCIGCPHCKNCSSGCSSCAEKSREHGKK